MKTNHSALVLFSGGQDSTTCLFWAKKHFDNVMALCFSYGQKHSIEIEIAKKIAQTAEIPIRITDASFIGKISESSLTNDEIIMDNKKPKNSYPNTFVPGRNLFFLSLGAVVAHSHGIHNLITGVSQADYSGYPDCRENFIKSANETLNLAMDEHFTIHTPLMHLNKADIWALADELNILNIIKNETLTCYRGIIAEGCGNCPACTLRNAGWKKFQETKKF
ncbi:MAG: 7-cyano-7-deazaguanine synthase QueC [Bacteroidales bacterium]|jgi:7-cyano-7-deazaguanine synthase|nr:7-cyano-7-deazaguanine synthase QueC [Bacteroidales bacterium]